MAGMRSRLAGMAAVALVVSAVCADGPEGSTIPPVGEKKDERELDQALARVYPALVRIDVIATEPDAGRLQKNQGAGSGAIITKEGHVVTNHHVAGNTVRLECRMPDGGMVPATLVGTDPLADISVIKLRLKDNLYKGKPLQPAVFGDSDLVRVGDAVMALGSPMAVSQSVTKGIVSNAAMMMPGMFWPMTFTLDGEDVGTLVRWIGHDAVIFGGNSGGPLINMKGEIIGVNEVGLGSLGGAIPANLAKSVAEQLIATGKVTRSWTGLECQPRLKDSKYLLGVLVSGVIPGSPAEAAGLKAGDVLLQYDGAPMDCRIAEDLPVVMRTILSTPVGKQVPVIYMREDAVKSGTLTTVARDRARGEDREQPAWGITVRNFTLLSALELNRKDTKGVRVMTLRPGGPAANAKPAMEYGDVITAVNDKPVASHEELLAFTKALPVNKKDGVPVVVLFDRGTKHMATVVHVGKEPPEEDQAFSRKAWAPFATQVLTKDLAKALGLEGKKGVRVTQVFAQMMKEPADVKVGDVFLKLDDQVIDASRPEQSDVFTSLIQQYKVDSTVKLSGVRAGTPLEVSLKLGSTPPRPTELKEYENKDFELTVRELSFADRVSKELKDDVKGVLVSKVESAGWARLAHVAIDDVLLSINGVPTPDVAAVERLLTEAQAKKAERMVFFVKRGIHSMYLEVEPDWSLRQQ